MQIPALILALVLCYFCGAIPFGMIVARMRGVDIQAVGSGNIGATNVWRTLGPRAGSAVFILDVLKGFAAPFIAKELLGHDAYVGIALCAAMAVIGHTFSVFLRFRGGKGIATGLGVFLGLLPLHALACFALWGVVLLITRMISAASIAACIAALAVALFGGAPLPYAVVIAFMGIVALLKHIPNIKRIMAGTEPRVGQPKTPRSTPVAPLSDVASETVKGR